jgi:hypothetical protein
VDAIVTAANPALHGGSDLGEFVGSGARRLHVIYGKHDLDVRREDSGPGQPVASLVHHPADRRLSGSDLALGQPQQCQTERWPAAPLVGLAVRFLGLGELARQPVELGFLVEGGTGRGLTRRAREPFAPGALP